MSVPLYGIFIFMFQIIIVLFWLIIPFILTNSLNIIVVGLLILYGLFAVLSSILDMK